MLRRGDLGVLFFTGYFPNNALDYIKFGERIHFALVILLGVSYGRFNGFMWICFVKFEGD